MSKFRRKLSFLNYLLVVVLIVSSVSVSLDNREVKEAKAAVGNMHLFWTGVSAPDGWTIVSDGGGEAFYQKFIKGAATYGGTGTASTHNHTVTTSVNVTGAVGRDNTSGSGFAIQGHAHSSNTNVPSVNHLPLYRQIKVIEYTDGGVPDTIPQSAIAIFDGAPPAGWTTVSDTGENYNLKFVRSFDDATTTGGSADHYHSVTSSHGSTPQGYTLISGRGSVGSTDIHTHSATHTTSTEPNDPPYIDVILASKNSEGVAPIGMIGFFDDTLSYGWTSVSGGGSDFNGKYIRGNGSYDSVGGGSLTHSHDDSGQEVSTNGSGSFETGTGGSQGMAFGNHTHAVTYTNFSTDNNEPPYIEVVFAKKTAVYQPEINNWRWYADEEDVTPGTDYAAENTVPPQVEMGKSIGFKLRINFDEAEGVTGNNSRKKLQYSTSTSGPWTEVGSTTDTDKLFRYYDGGGTDNTTLSSVLITGSSSTYKGIHDESNSAAPSNSDHPASTIVEFEYSFENYNAAVNTLYYFSFSDEISGDVPLASGKSYPSLTTASAYDLTLKAPNAIYLGSWAIGSSTYAEYTFVGGEETTTIRDNRGQTSGNSVGWSLAAEITTELKYVSVPSSISAPVFTGSGLDNMTIHETANFTGSVVTYYKVEIDNKDTDTFKWSDDGGSTWDKTGIACSAVPYTLNNGVVIDFAVPFGHEVGDYWTFTATPETAFTILDSDMYFITNTITGLYDAPTTGISGNSGEYMGSPVTAASVSGSGKQGLGGFTFLPTLRMYNASTVGEYSGVITFTLT